MTSSQKFVNPTIQTTTKSIYLVESIENILQNAGLLIEPGSYNNMSELVAKFKNKTGLISSRTPSLLIRRSTPINLTYNDGRSTSLNNKENDIIINTYSISKISFNTSGNNVFLMQSVEDVLLKNKLEVQHGLRPHNMRKLVTQFKNNTGLQRGPTIFIPPNTSVIIAYDNGQSKTINNNNPDAIIMLNSNGILSINVNNINAIEQFDENCNSLFFSYYDIMFFILLVLLVVYLLYASRRTNIV